MIYLLLGHDTGSKDLKLGKLRQELFGPSGPAVFNQDILHGRDLDVQKLQETLLCLPPEEGGVRLVVIRGVDQASSQVKEQLLQYAKAPYPGVNLILDMGQAGHDDDFAAKIGKQAQVLRFREERTGLNSFDLSRQVSLGRAAQALKVLHQLIKAGERPERILGGLRSALERENKSAASLHKRLRLLLACDLDIKTGRMKPVQALERLIVSLCASGNAAS